MKIRTVRFREGREGDPIARWEGKVAFPDRRTPVTAGRLYRVLEARPNPKGTVYFLEVEPLDLEALARQGEGERRAWYEPPYYGDEVAEAPTPRGLCRAVLWEGEGRVTLELYPWGEAYRIHRLRPPVEVLPGVEVDMVLEALAPEGQPPAFVLGMPTVTRPELFPALEEDPYRRGEEEYREALQEPLRLADREFVVGYRRVPLPPAAGLEAGGFRLTGWTAPGLWPEATETAVAKVKAVAPSNLHEWRLLSRQERSWEGWEEGEGEYMGERWGTGTYHRTRMYEYTYLLEHRASGERREVRGASPIEPLETLAKEHPLEP